MSFLVYQTLPRDYLIPMRIIVTAGPTRQYIDAVRFITNASSGRMGCAVAAAAVKAGHDVTLLCSGVTSVIPAGCSEVVRFDTVADLQQALGERFEACDALVMAAAVGDFHIDEPFAGKLHRSDGPVTLRLSPTQDILAGLANRKRDGQAIIAFAVEQGTPEQIEAAAGDKLRAKNADYVVVNTPAALAAETSRACILSADGVVLAWADRPKEQLAEKIVGLLRQGG
ncbi:MAG: phosphopantothenoylcysteine decarboxylase [Planctomycetota bacterium]|nr:phosphopantothenoylcysteine decarboxylase [Planctomycetota bacterium]